MLRSLANGRAAWFAFKSLMPFSVLIAVLLMAPDIVDDSSWSQATEQLLPCLMALGLACVVAWSYWQEFRRSLSHQELLLDDLALLRRRRHPAALLSDDALVGLSRTVASLCRHYEPFEPPLTRVLDAYQALLRRRGADGSIDPERVASLAKAARRALEIRRTRT